MNILFISEFFPDPGTKDITGGVENRCYYLANELSSRHDVAVIASRRPGQKKQDKIGKIKIYRLGPAYDYTNYGHIISRIAFSFSVFMNAGRIARKNNADVSDSMSYFAYPGSLVVSGRKKFVTYHEVWLNQWVRNTGKKIGLLGELVERILLLLFRIGKSRMISVSAFTRDKLVKAGLKDVHVVNNGIDISRYSHKKKSSSPTVCVVSRLIPQKNVDDILYAFFLLQKRVPDAELDIIGQGGEKENLMALSKKLRLRNVTFHGFMKKHEDVINVMRRSHVYVNASVREGFGISLLEACACGTPYVCTDIEPFREVSKGGRGGYLFQSRNFYEIADSLILLLENKKTYDGKAKECIDLAQEYSWDRIAKEIEAVYSKP